MHKKKVLIAAGGTGGHMFPAQALALSLKEAGYEVLFAGAKLDTNAYFQKEIFSYKTVSSSSMAKGAITRHFAVLSSLAKGFMQSWRVIQEFKPDLIVGFGSFHTAPVLMAAACLRFPFVLFESNAWPGRVNRFFSRFAKISAVQFARAASHLSGKKREVSVPFWQKNDEGTPSREAAMAYYGLKENLPTLLVFGGSQGARSVNRAVRAMAEKAVHSLEKMQIIHFTGSKEPWQEYKEAYEEMGISCCVKPFEEKMAFAWTAADIAICRAGAATIAELVRFEIPSILIPFPKAAEDHQKVNAQELQNLGASLCLTEDKLSKDSLWEAVKIMISKEDLQKRKKALKEFSRTSQKESLTDIVKELLNSK